MMENLQNIYLQVTRKCPYDCITCAYRKEEHEGMSCEEWINNVRRIGLFLSADKLTIMGDAAPMFPQASLYSLVRAIKHRRAEIYTSSFSLENWPTRQFVARTETAVRMTACHAGELSFKKPRHTEAKAVNTYEHVEYFRHTYPESNHSIILEFSICKLNADETQLFVNNCVAKAVTPYIDYIHFDLDGQYDVFRSVKDHPEKCGRMIIDNHHTFDTIERMIDALYVKVYRHRDPRYQHFKPLLAIPLEEGRTGSTGDPVWHCEGGTIGGLTVGEDGYLRLCPYRKGKEVNEIHISEFKEGDIKEWKTRMKSDAKKCPGCGLCLPMEAFLQRAQTKTR